MYQGRILKSGGKELADKLDEEGGARVKSSNRQDTKYGEPKMAVFLLDMRENGHPQ